MEGFQPAMMSFKAFLQTQDDQISDEEAIRKYAEYKLEFKRQQLNEFFVTHKEEEWFKQKYHPEESVKRKQELQEFLKRRVHVFQEFQEQGKFEDLPLDGEKQDLLVRVLDSVVIKLEGGTEHDLGVLDLPDQEEEERREEEKRRREGREERERERRPVHRRSHSGSEPPPPLDDENARLMKKAKEFLNFMEPAAEDKKDEGEKKEGESKKRKHSEGEEGPEGEEEKPPGLGVDPFEKKEEEGKDLDSVSDTEEMPKEPEEKKEDGEKETDNNETKETEKEEKMEEEKEEENEEKKETNEEKKEENEEKKKEENGESEDKMESSEEPSLRPRALHKTSSIFLRNLAPTITKVEVEAMCRRYGFLFMLVLPFSGQIRRFPAVGHRRPSPGQEVVQERLGDFQEGGQD